MFADYPPERENTRGGRWNPPQVPAIYLSLSRDVVLAEAEYQSQAQPVRPKTRRTIYRVKLRLGNVLEIPDSLLRELGIHNTTAADYFACQSIGGAVERIGHDGLIVSSARASGKNLVIYPNRTSSDYSFEVLDADVIDPGMSW